ncbi:MAG: biopolymer transporter ExbD [Hyphomicrobiaceae bacterium]|nr:biopolymer transporter ExbD [Hyphomicrobiaceae bacterium]
MRIEESAAGKSRLSLTPVIDVVFLLLLFFMLASTFTRFANVEIGLAGKAVRPASENQMPLVLISVKKGSRYAVNGQPVALDEMQAALSSAAVDGKARLVIRPSEDALAEDIVRAVEQSQASKLGPVIMMR